MSCVSALLCVLLCGVVCPCVLGISTTAGFVSLPASATGCVRTSASRLALGVTGGIYMSCDPTRSVGNASLVQLSPDTGVTTKLLSLVECPFPGAVFAYGSASGWGVVCSNPDGSNATAVVRYSPFDVLMYISLGCDNVLRVAHDDVKGVFYAACRGSETNNATIIAVRSTPGSPSIVLLDNSTCSNPGQILTHVGVKNVRPAVSRLTPSFTVRGCYVCCL